MVSLSIFEITDVSLWVCLFMFNATIVKLSQKANKKKTSWMPDSASFDKFWNIFQNLCLFFLGLALFLHLIETGMFKILNDRTYNTQKKKEKDIWAVLRLCTSLFSLSVNLITFITIYATHLYVPSMKSSKLHNFQHLNFLSGWKNKWGHQECLFSLTRHSWDRHETAIQNFWGFFLLVVLHKAFRFLFWPSYCLTLVFLFVCFE